MDIFSIVVQFIFSVVIQFIIGVVAGMFLQWCADAKERERLLGERDRLSEASHKVSEGLNEDRRNVSEAANKALMGVTEAAGGDYDLTIKVRAGSVHSLTFEDQGQQKQGSQGNTTRGAAARGASLSSGNGDRHDG